MLNSRQLRYIDCTLPTKSMHVFSLTTDREMLLAAAPVRQRYMAFEDAGWECFNLTG
ncbi:MAG: hypothetical protein ABI723_13340 [Bacteroidia bacterium]